ncbi:type II toxin-antitoxin system Phd/YefM family antitoxin [Kocuria sp. M1R5S2]|uniref:type II toxin-antitoxin system Phd/YefM family antitoxin n=1 Tax=Kocuria rhizosphaerae TaxID=3376285 RepID=UPI0037B4DE1A
MSYSQSRSHDAATLDPVVNDREEVVITRAGREPVVIEALDEHRVVHLVAGDETRIAACLYRCGSRSSPRQSARPTGAGRSRIGVPLGLQGRLVDRGDLHDDRLVEDRLLRPGLLIRRLLGDRLLGRRLLGGGLLSDRFLGGGTLMCR